MYKYLFLLILLCAAPAFADAPDAPALNDDICRYLVTAEPADMSGAAYTPGVDVRGNPVVGAELDSGSVEIDNDISFPVTIDVMEYAGLQEVDGLEGEAVLGTITVRDGELFFNDRPLRGGQEQALVDLCRDPSSPSPEEE